MKLPYFVSGFEVQSASHDKLFKKLFELKSTDATPDIDSDDENAPGLDLLQLK